MISPQRTAPRGSRLGWVEAGRGCAAVMVMFSHIYIVHPTPLDGARLSALGDYGVGFFFVLSGFIMCHVHGDDVGRPATTAHFVWRRLVRLWPTYLIVLVVALAINQLLQRADARVGVDAGFLARQVLLLPGKQMFVGPAWTLRHELFFYALFALLLADRRLGFVVFAAWGALLAWHFLFVGMWTTEVDRAPDLYLHHVNLAFFEGMALGLAERRGFLGRFILLNAVVGAAMLLVARTGWPIADPRIFQAALWPVFGALLGGLIWLSARVAAPRVLIWLGAISYSLYLIHLSVYTILRGVDHVVGRPLDPIWPVRVLIQLAAALTVAGLLHHYVERPILRRLGARKRVFGISVAKPAAAPSMVAARSAPLFTGGAE